MGKLSKNNFIPSLSLPDGITAYRYDGMNRVHFKCHSVGFTVIDMKNDCYNLGTREEFLRDIGVYQFEKTNSLGPNNALLRDIPYEDTEVLFKLINYKLGGEVPDINTPMKPRNRIRKSDGSINYICGRCGISFLKSPRCPECGQLVKE